MTRMNTILLAGLLLLFAAAPARAQQDAARDSGSVTGQAHHALKGAGRGIKSGAKSAGSKIHHALKTAGNKTKTALKRATGDTVSHKAHKPGGINKVARDVSGAFKRTGRHAKASLKQASGRTHKVLKHTGRDVKSDLKRQSTDTAPRY